MKGESKRRAMITLVSLLVALAASLGAATAPVAAELPPGVELLPSIDPQVLEELQGLHINLEALLGDPIVEDVDPNGGLTTGGNEVVITGVEFTGATAVTFGGTPATSFTVDLDTQITAIVPMHAPGTVQVQVTTPGGESPDTSADDYTYVESPATTAAPTTAAPTTEPPTTAAPTETTMMPTTTIATDDEGGGGLSGGWIAFIVVIAVVVVGGMGTFVYRLGKRSK
jgi:hypothetical protein